MKINIAIERSVEVPVPPARARGLLDDLEATLRRFPKLRHLKKLGEDRYLWEMKPIGSRAAGIAHEVSYAAKYAIDRGQGRLSWQPLPRHGNADIAGELRIKDVGAATKLYFSVSGELRDVPVPLMYRLLATPFIQGKFTRLVDIFLDETRAALLAQAPA